MSKSVKVIVALVAILLLVGRYTSGPDAAEEGSRKVQQWEYMAVSKPLGEFQSETLPPWLTDRGKEGWELCDVVQHGQSRQCIFKRPKQ